MSLPPDLVNLCLVVEGFPPEICSAEVAREVSAATKIPVRAISPWNPDPQNSSGGGWLLRLHSHNDQKTCLHRHRTFIIKVGNSQHQVKLDYPHVSVAPKKLDWIDLMEEGGERIDSVASEDMYGDGDGLEVLKLWLAQPPSGPQDPPPPSGPQGKHRPPYRGPGAEQFSMMPPSSVGQGFSDRHFSQQYSQPGYGPGQSQASPSLSTLGVDPRSDVSPSDSGERGWQNYPYQQAQPDYLAYAGQAKYPFPQSGQYPRYESNPIYPIRPAAAQEGAGSVPQGMAHVRVDPAVQYPGQYGQQPVFYDARSGSPDFQDPRSSAGEDSKPEQQRTYLRVTELPDAVMETELKQFFQNRSASGGGAITSIRFNPASKSAAIVFDDVDDVERVLQRAPLLFKNKKIQVEARSMEDLEEEEEEKKTVEVRGLETEEDSEMCIYYFENPAKGGGEIESSQWIEADKVFLITFVDATVAQAVASKGHKLGSKVLEVSLYTPPTEDDDLPQCTVLVTGFDPSKRDLYDMYFSNPHKGGDNIVELKISEDESAMFITFETPEVAQRIVERPHKVGGRQLEVVLAPIEHPTPPSTVMVTGCDLKNPDIYRYYFENPRRGGGEISDFVVDEKLQAIVITFAEPEVVQQLVDIEHKVKNSSLQVTVYTPPKSPPEQQASAEPSGQKGKEQQQQQQEEEEEEKEEEEPAPKTVVVTVGPHEIERPETYELYFESSRSGGGQVEDVDVDKDKKLVYVTFSEAGVAARVAAKMHKLNSRSLEVALYVPPKPKPMYPKKLLFKNVADSTTPDCLSMFLERVTDLEPVEVLYGDEMGTVLVTFDQEPDLPRVLQLCQKRTLEGRKLAVSKVPISNCLLVDNLSPATTQDTVQFYFENRRNKGGAVEHVELVPGERKCFVYFEDHTVLDGILSKSHRLDSSQLQVKRYLECLGQSGGSKDPTAFTMPGAVTMDSLDRYKVAFLRQSQSAKAAFQQQLCQTYARGEFSGDGLLLHCTLTTDVPKARTLARTWGVDVRQTVESFMNVLEVQRREVMQQLWVEVEKAVSGSNLSGPEGAVLFTLPEETAFVVVGMGSMVQELFQKLISTVKGVEEAIERRNQEVTETNGKLKPFQLRLLLAMGFQLEAEKRHQGLKVDIQLKKNSIVFEGLMKDVKEAQVEMYEILQPIQSDKMTKLSHTQKQLLMAKEVKPHIVQKLKKENIVAVWEKDQQSQVTVSAFSDRSLVEAIHIINKSVPEHVCELPAESMDVLHGTAWSALVGRLMSANPGVLMITPDHQQGKVFITSIDSLMHGVVEEVEVFLQENSIYSQVVRFSPSRQLFVQREWHQRLLQLQNRLQAYKVQITTRDSGTEFFIKGTRQGLAELRKGLEELNAKIVCHEEKVRDVAMVRCLNSPHTERDLIMLGQTNHCVLSLSPESPDLQIVEAGSAGNAVAAVHSSGSVQTMVSMQLPNGTTIAAVQGDITQLPVDAIVNAANDRMDHIGGLARDIVQKGGKVIQEESYRALKAKGRQLVEGDIVVTGAGNLRCKAVVHAVGPVYRGGHSGEADCLHDTIMKCITAVAEAGHSSIAFPAISTGIFRFPAKEATRVIAEAVKAFLDSHRKCTLKSVYLCHLNNDIAQMFVDAIQRVFPSARSVSSLRNNPPKPALRGGKTAGGATPMAKSSKGQRVISVALVEGEIAKQSADVIINSTSNGLDLRNGAISSSLLKVAGAGLQDECKRVYPKGIKGGEVAVTGGHSLACKKVYHLALCNWMNPNAQQVLGASMVKCLIEASKQHYQSIAFPVLGTGNLGYPPEKVAETMLGAIEQFQQDTPSTSLRNASIVVYHGQKQVLQIFHDLHQKMGGGVVPQQPQPAAKPSGSRQGRKFSGTAGSQPKPGAQAAVAVGTSAVFEIGGLKLVIKQGDITEEDTDAIVNSTNKKLDLSRGNVAGVLKTKCGEELIKECARKVGDIQQRGVTHTKAYNLKSHVILHINSEQFCDRWQEAIKLCLQEAEALAVGTMAMPALGTGAYGLTPSLSATALFETLVKSISDLKSLKELRVVLFDFKMIPPFVTAVEELGDRHAKSHSGGGLLNWIKSTVRGSTSPSVKQTYVATELKEAILYIYAGNKSDVPRILRAFDDLVKERVFQKEINDEVVLTLGHEEMEQIYELRKEHKVEISVQQARGRVVVEGLQTDVFEALHKISSILRQVERTRQELQSASMLANMVQWSYLETTTTGVKAVEYAQRENQIIELAYQSKKKNAEITDNDRNCYIIDFDSMMEYPKLVPSDTVSVIRQDKMKEMASGNVPANWATHGGDEHVKVVAMKPADQEYKDVEKNLRATLGNRNITVTAIDRIQNRTLYQQYAAKKSHLEKQNQGVQNERTLWHGTGPEAIVSINNYGFNRGYCGKNATAYGEGVYFAVNSYYSTHATYATTDDAAGKRFIYQCKVLVGHPTQGKPKLRVLPPREGDVLFDSATDSLQNSNMFIIFNDTQAYPEYLITFNSN